MSENNTQILIFDTNLRDGKQVPECKFNTTEKIQSTKLFLGFISHATHESSIIVKTDLMAQLKR